jgi:Mrp family chromosome partitioning ATPase
MSEVITPYENRMQAHADGAGHDAPAGELQRWPEERRQRPRRQGRQAGEPFDALLWRLHARQVDAASVAATVGLTGCEPRAGVSTLAANLAVRASELELGPVLLVEAHSERPRLQRDWKATTRAGLSELLSGEASLGECLSNGPARALHFISAGGSRHAAPLAWDVGAVDAFLAEACADHSLVLFDLPPVQRLQRATLLAKRLDEVLLVIRAERTHARVAQRAVDRLLEEGLPLVGAVLNRQRSYLPRWLKRWV